MQLVEAIRWTDPQKCECQNADEFQLLRVRQLVPRQLFQSREDSRSSFPPFGRFDFRCGGPVRSRRVDVRSFAEFPSLEAACVSHQTGQHSFGVLVVDVAEFPAAVVVLQNDSRGKTDESIRTAQMRHSDFRVDILIALGEMIVFQQSADAS